MFTGDITSGQTGNAEGGQAKQDASAQFTIPVALMNLGSMEQRDFYGNRFNLQNLRQKSMNEIYGSRFNLQNLLY